MPRFLLFAAFLDHLLPVKNSSSKSDLEPDAEKCDPDVLDGTPRAGNDDVEDNDQENFDASDDEQGGPGFTEGEEDEPRPTQRRGVRLVSTSTISSMTLSGFTRPSIPKCLFKIKDVLFGSPTPPDETAVSAPNYRLTPIISGSLIPFSILLQIPGLTEHWYVRTDGTTIVESRKNSALLESSLIISMTLVVFANLALICRFLERRVKTCTILCIVALTIHGKPFICVTHQMHISPPTRSTEYCDCGHVRCPTSFQRWLHVRRSVLDDDMCHGRSYDNECYSNLGPRQVV